MKCLDDSIKQTEGFKTLKRLYPNFTEGWLKDALAAWQEKYNRTDETFPTFGTDKGLFTKFIKANIGRNFNEKKNTSEKELSGLVEKYDELNSIYTPQVLRNRVLNITNRFSGIVTRYNQQEGNQKKSRKQCISELGGFRGIMASILKDLTKEGGVSSVEFWYNGFKSSPKYESWSDEQLMEEAEFRASEFQTMATHFNAFSPLVIREIAPREGMKIKYDQASTPIDVEEAALDEDKPQNNTEDGEGAKGDRFVDFRILSLDETLSEKTKLILDQIEERNADGSFSVDDLGQVRTIGGREVSYKLLEIFSKLDPTRDYVQQLKEQYEAYPWLRGLVLRLEKDADLKTFIYLDFRRAVYKYTHIRMSEDGKEYEHHYENTSNLQNALMRNAANIMRSGVPLGTKYSIYDDGGLKSKSDRQKEGTEDFAPGLVRDRLNELLGICSNIIIRSGVSESPNKVGSWYETSSDPREAMRTLLSDWDANGNLDFIIDALRGIGMDFSKEYLKDAAMRDINKYTGKILKDTGAGGVKTIGKYENAGNRLGVLLAGLSSIYGDANERVGKGKYDIDAFLALNSVNKAMMSVNIVLAPSLEGDVEPSTLVGSTRMQTYNKPNLLHDVFDVFRKGGTYDMLLEKYESKKKELIAQGREDEIDTLENKAEEYIKRNYLDCEGYTIDGRPIGWLKAFIEDGVRIDIEEGTTFNGVEYAMMSPSQKLTSAIVHMMAKNGPNSAEVPIMADYGSAYNFISGFGRIDVGDSVLKSTAGADKKAKLVPFGTVQIDPNSDVVERVIDEVLAEIEVVKAARERLAAAKEGKWEKIDGYDDRAAQFNLFKEFNDNGFYEDYLSVNPDSMKKEARELVRKYVVEQLAKIVEEDLKYFYESGIYDGKALAKTLGYTTANKNGVITVSKNGIDQMIQFSLSSLYARQQITKMLNGGMAQFESVVEFEKRAMMNHAPRSPFYKDATWNGKPVREGGVQSQAVVYLKDSVVPSDYKPEIETQYSGLEESEKITKAQRDYFISAFDNIKETDGQGYRTFDSWREIMICTGHWSNELEDSFWAIKNGTFDVADVDRLIRSLEYYKNFKPVMTGYEFIDGYGDNPDIKLSVTHKYAETVLLPTALLDRTMKGASTPFRAMSKAAEELAKRGQRVDMFLFKSGVKVNAHSVIDAFTLEEGKEMSSDNIAENIVKRTLEKKHAIHKFDYAYYGEAAATPVHVMNSKIAWAAQAETMAFSDIEDGDMVFFGGEYRTAKEARELYDKIKFSEALAALRELDDIFRDPNRLEAMLQEELASKSYNSPEVIFALQQIKEQGFAIPLFASTVSHEVQELFSSIIRKRLTSHKTKGANIFQSTSFGLDGLSTRFTEEGYGDAGKLKIEWENKGIPGKQRIKYIECYLPLTDKALLKFADKDGGISPVNLQHLIDEGKIPESVLYAIGYRTPSDGVHSVFPLKIKGFTSNVEGANILLPKEAMTLAGLDFDGDKLRVHLKSFKTEYDEELMREDYERRAATDENITKAILGQKQMRDIDVEGTFEEFKKGIERRTRDKRYFRIVADEYDYSKAPHEQTSSQRDNGRIDLMFANITSVVGTEKLLIPGGAEESVRMAKANYIVQHLMDEGVVDILESEGVKNAKNGAVLVYNEISKYSVDKLSKLIDRMEGYNTPFSARHAVEAHERIVGGKQLVSVYAMHNSVMQTLQRLDLHYIPRPSKFEGKTNDVYLFGKKIDKLYDTRVNTGKKDKKGTLLSRVMSRFLNAAVDNAKEPILGLVNQTKELAVITNFLIAAGLEEEEIHLFMAQPVMKEMGRRLKSSTTLGIRDVISELIMELSDQSEPIDFQDIVYESYRALGDFNKLSREDYITALPLSYGDISAKKGQRNPLAAKQLSILYGLAHLEDAISELRDLSALVRPESHSGMIETSVSGNVVNLDKFYQFAQKKSHRISGYGNVLPRYIDTTLSDDTLWEMGGDLPYIHLLNSAFFVNSNELLMQYFPLSKPSWQEAALKIAGEYNYRSKYESTMEQIAKEMVLWKLLGNKAFTGGTEEAIEDARRYYVIDFPNEVAELLARIRTAKEDEDPAAFALKGNIFLKKLTVRKPKYTKSRPRIQFQSGGPSLGKLVDSVRRDWAAMMRSSDPKIRKMATDLYIYNLYTNGFGFGKYEFSHLAPFSVLVQVPGFMQALNSIASPSDEFADVDSEEFQRFKTFHILNHWDDAKLVPHFKVSQIPAKFRAKFGFSPDAKLEGKQIDEDDFAKNDFVVIVVRRSNERKDWVEKKLYVRTGSGENVDWEEAPMLGTKLANGQAFIQMNPESKDPLKTTPIATGDSSVYGEADDYGRIGYKTRSVKKSTSIVRKVERGEIGSAPSATGGLRKLRVSSTSQSIAEAADKMNEEILASNEKGKKNLEKEKAESEQRPDSKDVTAAEEAPASEPGVDVPTDSNTVSPTTPLGPPRKLGVKGRLHMLVREVSNGESTLVERTFPVTPSNLREARRQRAYVRLNRRLERILKEKSVAVGTLYDFEERLAVAGVTDFDTPRVTAEGLIELIRLSEGKGGFVALPEEFSHLSIEMLGHEHPLVKRLLSAISSSESALREAYGGMYDVYVERYGKEFEDNAEGQEKLREKLILEAAGKLVAKELLYQEEIESSPIRRLVKRVVDAIKNFFRQFSKSEIKDAVMDADEVASQLARNLLSGRLLDDMTLENIGSTGKFLSVQKDLTDREMILDKLLKKAVKRKEVFEKRLRFTKGDKKDAIVKLAEEEIASLEKSIDDLTVEEGITKYLSDCLGMLKEVERLVDDLTSPTNRQEYGFNTICRYLRIYKDAVYSVSKALEDVEAAMRDREFASNEVIEKNYQEAVGQVKLYNAKYQRLAMDYFEELLSSVYGPHGKTWTIGKNKGKTISIHDMARRADHDITLASRYFHALADCPDLVLKAFDDTVRNAKKNARKKANLARAKMDAAMSALVRETGSRDQSFMFEYRTKAQMIALKKAELKQKLGKEYTGNEEIELPEPWASETDMNKPHKSGRFISAEDAQKLPDAQRKFYNTVMEIKKEIDSYLPESEVSERKIIMISKSHMERAMQSDDVRSGAVALWEGVRNSILDTSDDIDYENEQVKVDFAGNRIDMLPIRYVRKNPKLTYDDMSDDVASTVLAYAGMGYEYNELSAIADWLEVSKDMAGQRDVAMKTGQKKQMETIGDEESDYTYTQPYTVKQMQTKMQDALNDFFFMHMYGGLQRDEGTIGNTRIDKRKAANMLNHIASLSQMAVNLQQRISNVSTGISMVIIESAGKGAFKAKDVAWGTKIWTKYAPDRVLGFGSLDNDNKLALWIEYHDVTNDNGRELRDRGYGKSRAKRTIGENILYSGMLAGEDYLASVTSLAVARNFKVKNTKTGQVETLWDAYEVAYVDPANKSGAYLKLKDGYTKLDGTAITEEDEKRFSKKVAGVNFELQGIYNLDDKSAIQQYALGALIIMYRKWIAPALKRRYGGVDYNILKEEDVEGYYRTSMRFIGDAFNRVNKDGQDIISSVKGAWADMNDYEKGNCKKAMTELAIVLGCVVAIAALSKWKPGDDDDEDKPKLVTWLDHQFFYQLLRLRNEIGSQAPTPMLVDEASKILKSPMAATRPLAAGLDAFQLLVPSNYFTEVRSGRYKGHTKAYKYFHDLPIISMSRNIGNAKDPSSLIKFYNSKSF